MSRPPAVSESGPLPPLPKDHVDHPENWVTGDMPATDKQLGFISVLEKQHPELVPDGGLDKEAMDKSEACEVINDLKSGKVVRPPPDGKAEAEQKQGDGMESMSGPTEASTEGTSTGQENQEDEGTGGIDMEAIEATQKEVDGKLEKGETADDPIDVDASPEQPTSEDADDELSSVPTRKRRASNVKPPAHEDREDSLDGIAGDVDQPPAKKPRAEPSTTDGAKQDESSTADEKPTSHENGDSANGDADKTADDTAPGDGAHLDHPENWATGGDAPTDKQIGFIKVLEKQKGVSVDTDHLNKSEASEKIDELKKK